MRLHHFTLVFAIVAIAIMATLTLSTKELSSVYEQKTWLDHAFDQAIDAAAGALVELDSGNELVLHKEEAIECFFQALYAGMGILDNPEQQEQLQAYVPLFAIIANDGCYLYVSDTYEAGGYTYVTQRWSERVPYQYEDEDFVYNFTLGNSISLYDKNGLLGENGQVYHLTIDEIQSSALYAEFRRLRPESLLLDSEAFLLIQRETIIARIEEELTEAVNHHNRIAQNYGITYQFVLPVMDGSHFVRSIDSPTLIAMFQGYPYEGSERVYNRYTSVGAYIQKNPGFVLQEKSWYYLYHAPDCTELSAAGVTLLAERYDSVQECAAAGAYACSKCQPEGVHVEE